MDAGSGPALQRASKKNSYSLIMIYLIVVLQRRIKWGPFIQHEQYTDTCQK